VSERPRISAIIPVRNRSGIRFENCLGSLRWQDVGAKAIEIIVSDFGSDPEQARSIAELAEAHGARVVRTETAAYWNRSRALNIGIRASSADVLFCTDADMIFFPNFVSSILQEHTERPGKAMVVCKCSDLPESVGERRWRPDDLDELRRATRVRRSPGTGACQAAPRDFFFHARGYDEKYWYWGKEDLDMFSRAERYGLEPRWIHEKTTMMHQWHPESPAKKKGLSWRWNDMRWRFTRHRVVKNRRGWGE
jgi:glycosyltransferase involved in cell wall biosynthesis